MVENLDPKLTSPVACNIMVSDDNTLLDIGFQMAS